jgi:hypothetical protein
MENQKTSTKSAKRTNSKCKVVPNALIYNRTTSSKGDWTVNKSLAIASDSNSVIIKQADFAEIATILEKDDTIGFRIQDHRQSNSAFNTTAMPAIVVKFTHKDEETIFLDVMESLPGTEFDRDDVFKRYSLVVDAEMFLVYSYVVKNDLEVAESMAAKKRDKKTIDLT